MSVHFSFALDIQAYLMLWSCDDMKCLIFLRSIKVRTLIFGYVVNSTINDIYIKLYGY